MEPASAPLVLLMVAEAGSLLEDFEAVELGDQAEMVLVDPDGEVLAGAGSLADFPAELVEQARSGLLRSRAGEFPPAPGRSSPGQRLVGALADVRGSCWYVLSRQPARVAETAARRMRHTVRQAFGGALALVTLPALAANFTIVRPICRLARAQRDLAGVGGESTRVGEIAQLEESFALLRQNLHDRDVLSQVFLGRYQIVEMLGFGAMGTVFRGWDPKLERHVALKTLKIGAAVDDDSKRELAERLVKEAITLARLQHPNIVTVFDVVQQGDSAFIAMELVDGMSLERYLWHHRRLDASQAVPLAVTLLQALEAAHREGFVHHDVKPGNILLGENGAIKVTDFGVSELLSIAHQSSDTVCGTPGYLAPETILRQGLYYPE